MAHPAEGSIRERLAAYLAGESTLDAFKSWLVGTTWSLDQRPPPPGTGFADAVKLVLAEHSGGYRSDEELRDSLTELLQRRSVKAG